jgi:hypothetical protein
MNLQKFIEANDFKITGGSDYGWDCFGPNARYIDCDEEGQFSINTLFDSQDQTLYAIEAWDYVNDREYIWVHPDYRSAYIAEHAKHGCQPLESLDGKKFIELELIDDMFTKIAGIRSGEDYDARVSVPLTVPNDVLFELMKQAHEQDITLNQLVEDILWNAIRAEEARELDSIIKDLDEDGWDELAEDHWDDDGDDIHFTNTDDPVDFPVAAMKAKKKKKGKK